MRIDLGRLGRKWLEAGLDLIIPLRCAGCGRSGAVWCSACDQTLARLVGPLCPLCGRPVHRGSPCRYCLKSALPLRARSYARYQGPLLSAVLHLKYRPNRRLAAVMAGWLAGMIRQEGGTYHAIMPVPLAPVRLRQRGYNQAELLSAALASELNMVHFPNGLERVRETSSQVGLDPTSRWRNVERAFQAQSDQVQDSNVVLVDDLFTTGATLSSCAEALLNVGAGRILGLTVGRA